MLWESMFLWPLKITVVLFHELSHAAAAWLTGGEVVRIGLSPEQGGVTETIGGWRLLILNAGYLGSLATGVGLLVATRSTRTADAVAWLLSAALGATAIALVRPLLGFGFLFTVIAALALAALARWASPDLTRYTLRGIGIFSVLYAVFDIRDDVFRPGVSVSDATLLAEFTHVPAILWGVAWLVAGIALLYALRRHLV